MHDKAFRLFLTLSLVLPATSAACSAPEVNVADLAPLELTTANLPASPTNAVADDARAAALGRSLFFDRGLSADGTVGCVSCHDPAHGFSDPKARSVGVRGQLGDRHSMPITAAALHPYLLWDGKADSAWSQPLKAIENPKEMDFTRVEVARHVASAYREQYEAVFGAFPDLAAAPARAKPGGPAWSEMSEELRNDVQRVFANVGKAIEAYERKLLCTDTRFDKFVRGEVQLTDSERAGAAVFQQENCTRCHNGPSFSDGLFHDIGVPSTDRGRPLGAQSLLEDPFSGTGPYSDDRAAGVIKLASIARETAQEGAFRTASLRGVGQRTFFGHAAHEQTLRGFVLDIYRGGRGNGGGGRGNGRGGNGGRGATVGTLDPLLNGVNVGGGDVDDLVSFLHTLDCPSPPAELLDPESAR